MTARRPRLGAVGAVALAATAAVTWALTRHGWRWEVPAFWVWLVGLSALAWVDLRTRRLPRRMIALTAAAAVPLLAIASVVEGEPRRLGGALLGGSAYLAVMFLLYRLGGGGLGFGDVRLAPLLGAFVGYVGLRPAALGIVAGFGLGAVAGLAGLVTGRMRWRSTMPFGPFLCAGAALAIAVSGQSL